jgi:hypothetical protein
MRERMTRSRDPPNTCHGADDRSARKQYPAATGAGVAKHSSAIGPSYGSFVAKAAAGPRPRKPQRHSSGRGRGWAIGVAPAAAVKAVVAVSFRGGGSLARVVRPVPLGKRPGLSFSGAIGR